MKLIKWVITVSVTITAFVVSARGQTLGGDFWLPQPGSELEGQIRRVEIEERDLLDQMQSDESLRIRERVLLEIIRREVWTAYARRLGSVRRSSARIDLRVCGYTDALDDEAFLAGLPPAMRSGDQACTNDGACWVFWGYSQSNRVAFGVFEAVNEAAIATMARDRAAQRVTNEKAARR